MSDVQTYAQVRKQEAALRGLHHKDHGKDLLALWSVRDGECPRPYGAALHVLQGPREHTVFFMSTRVCVSTRVWVCVRPRIL